MIRFASFWCLATYWRLARSCRMLNRIDTIEAHSLRLDKRDSLIDRLQLERFAAVKWMR